MLYPKHVKAVSIWHGCGCVSPTSRNWWKMFDESALKHLKTVHRALSKRCVVPYQCFNYSFCIHTVLRHRLIQKIGKSPLATCSGKKCYGFLKMWLKYFTCKTHLLENNLALHPENNPVLCWCFKAGTTQNSTVLRWCFQTSKHPNDNSSKNITKTTTSKELKFFWDVFCM